MLRRAMKAKQTGFTLIELMLTVVLLAVLVGLGGPSLADFIRNSRITSKANDLLGATHLARTEAIKRRVPVTVCATSDASASSPTCLSTGDFSQWIVFVDADGDGNIDSGELILRRSSPASTSIKAIPASGIGGYVQFGLDGFQRRADGAAPTDLTIRLCEKTRKNTVVSGDDTSASRALLLTRTGRAQVTRSHDAIEAAGGCP